MKACLPLARLGLLTILLALALAPTDRVSAQQLDKVSLRYGFVATGIDALWTYGIETGIFRRHGIELELREGKGSAVTAQTVAAGTDDFGTDIDGGTFLGLAAKGLPATAVMAVAAKSPLVVLSPEGKPLTTPAALSGKQIAITSGDGPSALLPAFFKQNKVDPDSVTLVNMQPGPKLTSLLTGRVDGVATNVAIQPTIAQRGMKTYALMYADFGVVTPGLYLVASNETVKTRPDMVQRFVAAARESMEAARKDPQAAAASFNKVYPAYDTNMALGELKLLTSLYQSPDTEGKPLGTVSLADALAGAAVLKAAGSMPAQADVAQFVTNRFVAP